MQQLSLEIALLYKSFSSAAELWELVASTHPDYESVEVHDGYNSRKKFQFGVAGKYLRDKSATGFAHRVCGGPYQIRQYRQP